MNLKFLAALLAIPAALHAAATNPPPFQLVWGHAYHILPETHNNESGYFSLCEGLDGSIYVGTAKYGQNAYLVEFDPHTGQQRVVLDTVKVTGNTATGYAAQAKIHTRNFVGPSGKIYVGSKEGYRSDKNDKSEYPGGYVMTYDPRTGETENLGMPFAGQGVIDVTADEKHGLLYVITCEDQHWMLRDSTTRQYRELGPIITGFGTTLLDANGRANVLTKDFELAQHDPDTGKTTVRPIAIAGTTLTATNANGPVMWVLSADARHAFLITMRDPTLIDVNLCDTGATVQAVSYGKMIEGKGFDSRGALAWGPDGRLYAVVRIDNTTGYGKGYLHHLVRFDPATRKMEDLGVLAIENPDFFDFSAKKPWSHGYHYLPDGTLTPLLNHLAMIVAHDGTIYVTIIAPFTLLKIDSFKPPAPPKTAAVESLDKLLQYCDALEQRLPEFTKVAEVTAQRHIAGGLLGAGPYYQPFIEELTGRAGGLMHFSFDRSFKADRTDAEKANDVLLFGCNFPPSARDLKSLTDSKAKSRYVIGFGPRTMPALTSVVAQCDAFIDTGEPIANTPLAGWVFMAEFVGALTRHGKMPVMWKSFLYDDSHAWMDKYFRKTQFHDEYSVPAQPPAALGRQYLDRTRYHLRRLEWQERAGIEKAASLITDELAQGRQTIVASEGHMPWTFVGKIGDDGWARPIDVSAAVTNQVQKYHSLTNSDGALVLRLGYYGLKDNLRAEMDAKKQRVMLIGARDVRPEYQGQPNNTPVNIDLGCAFGDACVTLEGYPLKIFPPTGYLQAAVYEAINAEVLARLKQRKVE